MAHVSSMIANERFMHPFHPDGDDGLGEWCVQVVHQIGPAPIKQTVHPATRIRNSETQVPVASTSR